MKLNFELVEWAESIMEGADTTWHCKLGIKRQNAPLTQPPIEHKGYRCDPHVKYPLLVHSQSTIDVRILRVGRGRSEVCVIEEIVCILVAQ